ncbi:hypothetical protein ACF0H5_019570 [Mactra antiquata]
MSYFTYVLGILLVVTVSHVTCDYQCLCSYQVELEIFAQPDPSSNVNGYMYEFDCKPSYTIPNLDPKYAAVGNNRELGYVLLSSNTQIQKCQGNVPDIDRVVITTAAPTTPIPTTTTTTPMPTTTTPTTSMPTTPTTPMPTTPTTPMPTTPTTPMPTTPTTPMPTTPTTPIPTTPTTPKPTTTSTPIPITPTPKPTTPVPTTTTTAFRLTTAPSLCPAATGSNRVSTYGGSCYELVNSTANWLTARKNCHSKGGYLVSIQTPDQQNFVSSFLHNMHMRLPVWIGLNDRAHEEVFTWDNGVNATYYHWMPSRYIQHDHDMEDCVLLVPLRRDEWDDIKCSGFIEGVPVSHPWICQYS